MKKLLTLCLLALFAVMAKAQNSIVPPVLTAEPVEVTTGSGRYTYFSINLNLENTLPVMSFAFDVRVPQGVSVDGDPLKPYMFPSLSFSYSPRATEANGDRIYRFVALCSDMDFPAIPAYEGHICTIPFRASNDINVYTKPFLLSSNYGLEFFNVQFDCQYNPASYAGKLIKTPGFRAYVSVDARRQGYYKLGDVDHNNEVALDDVNAAVQTLVNNGTPVLEADMNWDKNFSISDVVALIARLNK